jgi:hypothetical protein
MPPSDEQENRQTVGSRLDRLFMLGFEAAAVALGLTLVYVSWGLFSGEIAYLPSQPPQEQQRIFANLVLATNVMLISLAALTLLASIKAYRDRALGYIMLAAGLCLVALAPWLIDRIYPGAVVNQAGAASFVRGRFRLMSYILLVPGVFFIVLDLVRQLREGSEERKLVAEEKRRAKAEQRPPIIFAGKCYHTAYCRDFIRRRCPVYDQRKACWKLRVGCYCDESLILGAITDPLSPRKTFDPRFSRSFIAAKSKELGGKKGKDRCRNCFLYQYHQSQKYRVLSPLVFVGTIVLMWKGVPLLRLGYDKLMLWAQVVIKRFAFSGSHSLALAPTDPGYNAFFWFMAFVFFVLFLSYSLQFLEWCIYKQQW